MDENQEIQESTYEVLNELAEHKINLNTASREDLEQLPFLSEEQIEDICEYQYLYGPMKSLGELAMIESLSYEQRRLLAFFIDIKEENKTSFPSFKNILQHGKSELIGNAHIPFYQRDGNQDGYLGSPYKHSFRYTYQYRDFFKVGLIGAKDAGEPFFTKNNKYGYDYYSYYLQLRKWGRIKNMVLGKYRLHIGMGLVMNNDFGLGKTTILASLGTSSQIIRPHASRTENNGLQGVAATIQVNQHIDATTFLSYRYIDATLREDSISISSIIETGYHRTSSEMNKKNNTTEQLMGANINFRKKGIHLGMTGIYQAFNRALKPNTTQIYRQYYPSGKQFWNVSTDYGVRYKSLTFHGETATGDCHALATINTLNWKTSGNMTLMALQRFYSYQYHALHGQSFSEGGSVQDESGIYVGLDWQPNSRLQLKYYTDFAYFAWPKYQANQSSRAWDHFISATYQLHSSTLSLRYRLKMREKDNDDKTALMYQYQHRGRFTYTFDHYPWTFKTQADLAFSRHTNNSFGWLITQSINYKYHRSNINASLAYFHTDNYDSRIYNYEKQTLYSFSFPMFYGEGIRYYLFFRQDIHPQWMIIAKVGVTHYFDRNSIGTGLQTIHHSSQTDLDLQFRWKF